MQRMLGTPNAFFVTGNERTPFNYFNPTDTKKSAYHLQASDKFFYLVELMNMNNEDALVYITMTYDYTEGALPAGWDDVKTVFLDANSCSSSEEESPIKNAVTKEFAQTFSVHSPAPWIPNIEGRIVDSIGHLHDGGVAIDINAGTGILCNYTAAYSSKPEYVAKKMGGMLMDTGDKVAVDHISNMEGCDMRSPLVKEMNSKQSWTTTGYYDYSKYTPNQVMNKELKVTGPGEVMAISIVLVAVKPGSAKPPPHY